MELFPSLRDKAQLHPPRGFSQLQMWIAFEVTIDTTTMQDHCRLPHLKS